VGADRRSRHGATVLLVAIYYLLPLDHASIPTAVTFLVIGLGGLVAMIVWHSRAIIGSSYPVMRAVEALATYVPLFLLLFAATYFVMARVSAANFTEPLTHTDALYFTVTVFSTVGFGDITAKTEVARVVVTLQMVADVVIIGAGLKIITSAVQRGRQRQSNQNATETAE
jgi:voltage-gated potassium channel